MHAEDLTARPDLAALLANPAYLARVERAFIQQLETFDWNCPQHIVPRYTRDKIATVMTPLRDRLDALERENAGLRAQLHGGNLEDATNAE